MAGKKKLTRKSSSKWRRVLGAAEVLGAILLFVNDVTGVGVADDPIAIYLAIDGLKRLSSKKGRGIAEDYLE
ncbi:MAG: hypothetical protein ACQXXE_08680 [Candidatus Bathyarchaeia archaeon]|jgi:hypothetical protein